MLLTRRIFSITDSGHGGLFEDEEADEMPGGLDDSTSSLNEFE